MVAYGPQYKTFSRARLGQDILRSGVNQTVVISERVVLEQFEAEPSYIDRKQLRAFTGLLEWMAGLLLQLRPLSGGPHLVRGQRTRGHSGQAQSGRCSTRVPKRAFTHSVASHLQGKGTQLFAPPVQV